MPYFVVTYAYSADTARRDEVRPAHRDFLGTVGSLVLSGPTDDDGAVLIFEDADAAAVEATLDADPFVAEGLVEQRTVRGWTPVKGRLLDAL
ncbi:YciI family protein [Kineococcus gynurae]|uniref:YciI family protein n=1 Tax=Kineococcus gynurae TaxID=452979 RepID=A0ABV5LS50_9ACTN